MQASAAIVAAIGSLSALSIFILLFYAAVVAIIRVMSKDKKSSIGK